MIRCVRCGTTNPDIAQYCDECGDRLQSVRNPMAVQPEIWRDTRLTMNDNDSNKTRFEDTQPESLTGWVAAESIKAANFPTEAKISQKTTIEKNSVEKTPAYAHARMVIERGKNSGKEFVLSENEVNIGRWDADNGIFPDVDLDSDDPEAKVSRRHARIVRYGSDYLIEDLGSTNGTFVNRGRRLLPGNRQILNDGDEIIVGKTFLRFQIIR